MTDEVLNAVAVFGFLALGILTLVVVLVFVIKN